MLDTGVSLVLCWLCAALLSNGSGVVTAQIEWSSSEVGCGIGQFMCDGRCVPLKWKCDGEPDCADGSDELSFCARCGSDEFRCQSGRCLPKAYICDGTADCGSNGIDDDSDEDPSICLHKAVCPPNFYSCRHEARCIHLSQFCNGIVDCNDHSDEHHKCDDWHNITCHYGVGLTIDGPMCYCPTDQVSIGDRCVDEDKCGRRLRGHAPICSQMCQNLPSGVTECDCHEDFKPNGSYCDPRETLGNYVAVLGNMFVMTPSVKWEEFPSRFQRTVNQNRRMIAAAADTKRNWICYVMAAVKADPLTYSFMECSRITKKSSKIMKTDITTSFPLDEVRIIRHDPNGDNWLFLVGRTRLVICKNEQPKMEKCRIVVDDVDIEDFVVDHFAGLIFYSTIGRNAGVWQVTYENRTKISMSDRQLQMPGGIALDPFSRTFYYNDRYFERIFALDYGKNGSVRSVLHDKRLKYSTSLTYFSDFLYVPSRGDLLRVDTMTSQSELVDFHTNVDGFFVNHNLTTRKGAARCSGCSEICVANTNSSTLCLFSDGMIMEGGKCTVSGSVENLILYSRQSPMWIHGVRLSTNDKSGQITATPSIPPIFSLRGGAVFTVDPIRAEIYFYDDMQHAIYRRSIHGGNSTLVTNKGVHHVTCMAYDSSSGNLYYGTRPNVEPAGITVFRPDAPDFRAQIVKAVGGIHSIFVDSKSRYLFYSSTTQLRQHNIVRARLGGNFLDPTILVSFFSFNPLIMTIDVGARKVYWLDPFQYSLYRIDFEGGEKEKLAISTRSLHSIAVLSGTVIWADDFGVKRGVSKGEGDFDVVSIDSLPITAQLYFVENKSTSVSKCLENNGGCEQLCYPETCPNVKSCDEGSRKCGCADGFIVDKNNPEKCVAARVGADAKCDEKTQFMCKHTEICIAKERVCDGKWDCYDGSDEDLRGICVGNFSCAQDEFRCDSMTCIPDYLVCDGRADCEDRSDEKWTVCRDRVQNCANGTFACSVNKQCLPDSWRCDGRVDCPDRSDEKNCEARDCNADEFQCLTGQCVPLHWVCDGRANCRDGSDELHCHEGCRTGREFRCDASSACLDLSLKCDGVVDCENGFDEMNCANISSTRFCRKLNEYLCKREQRCIRRSAVCDGVEDCSDGQDERKCKGKSCGVGLFACRSGDDCVAGHLECDGVADCADGSDEHEHCSFDAKVVEARCRAPDITCRTFTGIVCLPAPKICDGIPDCFDAKDEEFCGYEQQQSCMDLECQDACYVQPRDGTYTTVCGCAANRTLKDDGRTCEATERRPCDFGACSQHCVIHSNRTSHCFCERGYQMMPDGFTCRAVDSRRPFLLYSDRHTLMYLPSDAPRAVPLLPQLENAVSFDYLYHVNGTISIFWADVTLDTIFRVEVTGKTASNPRPIVSTGLSTVEGIAVDWISEVIYWTDSHHDHIQVAKIDGSMRATVVKGEIHNPRDIVVDPSHGLMFWTDWQEENPRIERATMGGNNRVVIFKVSSIVNAGWPNGLVCDIIAKRIYWVDAKSDTVHTVTYDGRDHVEVLRDHVFSTHPFSVDLFENYVYWTDWRINAIVRANKWNGSSIAAIFHTPIRPFYVKVVHRSKQPRTVRNPCAKSDCSHLCLIDGPGEYSCECPQFMRHKSGSSSICEEVKSAVLLSTKSSIHGVNVASDNDTIFNAAGFQDIRAIAASNDQIFLYDAFDDILWKYSTADREKRTVLTGDLSDCYGIAVDKVSGAMYYTSFSEDRAAIYVTNDGVRRSIFDSSINKELKKPKFLVFLENSAALLWLDVGYAPPAFFSAKGDGSKLSRISTDSFDELLEDVTSMAYDKQGNRVLWVTSRKSFVVQMNVKTWKVTPFVYANGSSIDALTVDQWTGDVFLMIDNVLVKKSYRSNSTDIWASGTNMTTLTSRDPFRVATVMDRTAASKCGLNSCNYLCVRSAKERYECLCPQGYTMKRGKCEVSTETLLLAGDKLLTATNGSGSVFLLHPAVAYKQWRKVAVEYSNELVYLISDFELWVAHLNGSYADRLLISDDTLTAVTVDPVTGNVILGAEIGRRAGEIVILDPKRVKENIRVRLLTDNEGAIRHLEMDPVKGFIFWSRGCIKKANYDGTNVTCLVNVTTNQFSLDQLTSRLCYLEKSGEVHCVSYDGTNNQVVAFFSVVDTVQSEMVIGNEKLYLAQRKRSASNFLLVTEYKREANGNFTEVMSYNTTTTLRFRATAVYRQKSADLTNSPCSKNNGGCSHLCISTPQLDSRCLCAYSLLQPNGSCTANPSFLSYSYGGVVDFVSISPNTTVPRGTLRFPDIPRGISVMEADPDRNQLILVDRASNRIICFRFTTNDWYSVADEVGEVEGISLDATNRELYYTRLSPPSIWRLSLSADDPASYPVIPTRVAFLGQGNKPKDIAVHPCRMLIFFTNSGTIPSVERMYYSGYRRERIIEDEIIGESRVSIDFTAEKLYISEITSSKIYRVDFDGKHKEVVIPGAQNRTTNTRRPFALAVYNDWLIYSNIGSYVSTLELAMVDKVDGLGERVVADTPSPVQSITVSAKNIQKCGTNACASLKCGDECRLSARGEPHCACRGERKLEADNVTCSGSEFATKTCAENEFLCKLDDKCIPYEETCDRYPDCAHAEDENVDMCSQRTCRPGYFNCGSGLCVALSKKCDRNNDCLNFADEIDCECSENEFRCESGICIAGNLTCDLKPDCNDASDEKNCPPRDCTNTTEFDFPGLVNCEGTTQCILPQWRCDGSNDCWDNSDEKDCSEIVLPVLPGLRPCSSDEFTCGRTRSCLPRGWVCDGQKDCADGSDEMDCVNACRVGVEYTCHSGDCVHIDKKCDGKKDCPDGDDEVDCDTLTHDDCIGASFQCRNGRCISAEWVCDGADDCADATAGGVSSDESNCTDLTTTCTSDEFLCRLTGTSFRTCLSTVHQCDGFTDCVGGSDENRTECGRPNRCRETSFRCRSGQCIPKGWICNGLEDCTDGSDEDKQMCSTKSSECALDEVACVKGERTTCISQEIICNQSHDCENLRYFAETMCGVNECKFDLCEEQCIDLPFAYRCECQPPKIVDPKNPASCIMGDQCSTSNCSQFCMEKGNGNYECACGSGYILEADKHGCKLKSRLIPPMLVTIASDTIRLNSLRDSYQTLAINTLSGRVLAYSSRTSSIYWIDESEVVGRTFTNGTTVLLRSVALYDPDGVAVDEFSGNIYWTSKSRNAIMMSDSENLYIKTVYRRGPGVLPYALAIDSAHRTIFWSDVGKKPSLNRMSIIDDDRGVDVVLDSSLVRPTALAVDPYAKRLYWIDQALNYLGVCNYDGANRQILGRKMGRGLYGLDVFGDFLFFSDYTKGTVEKMHKLTAKNRTTVVSGLSHPKGIQVVHPEKWPRKNENNPCENNQTCVQICVPTSTRHYATFRNFIIALLITTALVMLFFHKNRLYVMATPASTSWVGGQERYPLNTVTPDGGVENPVFESNEDTPMEPDPVVVDESNG
ncbi:hypothetical protein Y032_0180g824 [Ancylostoma ceylanicum]|uniref:EGF-like domain-containing protein n=1 Tax=Ancylostoma ceylanicum TaxID=53326 RepID=A0A016STE6_9BILA|nr:hypothetical protein Y032_0180g824 [Ancylostoma ceylanicum]